ncbi:MAG: guanine permease [Candidatus Omnitrophica bacterium 4484_70.1]|nr:MAG: guanine permease [Candidatus Omnitrophica bacterium 4484_70.1]
MKKTFIFKFSNSSLRQEIIGGFTTFITMSYIIFAQPLVLSQVGMDKGAVMVATCIASSIAMCLMAILANYPFALAPAMGHNFYFVYGVCMALGVNWQEALGANFIAGMIFILISLWGLRERVINSVPQSLKNAIAVGIGLLITLIGLEWSGIVVDNPGTLVGLGELSKPAPLLSIFGLFLITLLISKKVKGAILIGIIANLILSLVFGIVKFEGVVGKIPSLSPTFLKLDILGALKWKMLGVIFIFFFLDLFDTVGTLIGLGEQAGVVKEGSIPRAKRALLSDAIGTVSGTLLGTSTITTYIESSTGIAEGARTGLANLVTAALFLLSLVFYPLVKMVSTPIKMGELNTYPIVAPALIIVGSFMLINVRKIDWDDFTESLPAFITLIIIPLTFSITEGIAFGFITYTFLKLVTGKIKTVPPLIYIFSILFILRYVFLN